MRSLRTGARRRRAGPGPCGASAPGADGCNDELERRTHRRVLEAGGGWAEPEAGVVAEWGDDGGGPLLRLPDGHGVRAEPDGEHEHQQPVRRPRRASASLEAPRQAQPAGVVLRHRRDRAALSRRHQADHGERPPRDRRPRLDSREQRRADRRRGGPPPHQGDGRARTGHRQGAGRLSVALLAVQPRDARSAARPQVPVRQRHDGRRRPVRDPRRGSAHRTPRDPGRMDARRRDVLSPDEPAQPRRRLRGLACRVRPGLRGTRAVSGHDAPAHRRWLPRCSRTRASNG